jgi:diguanylate cyclase (GGDEF)-like protein
MGNTTIGIIAALAALGLVSAWLIARAIVRHRRQREEITLMLRRYDHRLAALAQALDDALDAAVDAPQSDPEPAMVLESAEPAGGIVLRTLELARDRTHAHAAVAAVEDPEVAPMLATVGLSQAEAAEVGRIGLPDYRGARALQVSFSGDTDSRSWGDPIRSGLVVPLFDSPAQPGMLVVLSRSPARRFSEADINELERVVLGARPALQTTLAAVLEFDPADDEGELWDRRSFQALVEDEIGRARAEEHELALLVVDVDRLSALNARLGHEATDEVLAEAGARLQEVAGRSDLPCEIGGGRFAVLLPRGGALDATRLFERVRSALGELPDAGPEGLPVSGGIAELLDEDDAAALVSRADVALGQAKASGEGLVVSGRSH